MAATAHHGDGRGARASNRGAPKSAGAVESCRVVIVGAGASGLQAAHTLRTVYGVTDVVVVEAADYIGGRVKQDCTFMPGKQVELGAEFMHGDATAIAVLAARHRLRLWWLCTWAQGDGGPLSEKAPDGGCAYYYVGADHKLARFDEIDEDQETLHEALWSISEADEGAFVGKHGRRNVTQFLRDSGVPKRMWSMADAGFSNTAGDKSENLSMANVYRLEGMYEKDGDKDARMEPSFGVLIDVLKADVDVRINWQARRVAVTQGAGGPHVRVVRSNGDCIQADVAIVTPSIAVLRDGDIAFSPPLLPHKRQALQLINFPNAMKCILKFSERPWPADCHGIVCSDSFIPEMWMNQTTTPATPLPPGTPLPPQEYMVTCFAMGELADEIQRLDKSTIVARALAQIDTMFSAASRKHSVTARHAIPSAKACFTGALVHFWKDSPFVRGGYTGPHHREPEWARGALREPHARLVLFAGEGLSGALPDVDSPSTLHGAMVTGETAAHDAARLLGATPRSKL